MKAQNCQSAAKRLENALPFNILGIPLRSSTTGLRSLPVTEIRPQENFSIHSKHLREKQASRTSQSFEMELKVPATVFPTWSWGEGALEAWPRRTAPPWYPGDLPRIHIGHSGRSLKHSPSEHLMIFSEQESLGGLGGAASRSWPTHLSVCLQGQSLLTSQVLARYGACLPQSRNADYKSTQARVGTGSSAMGSPITCTAVVQPLSYACCSSWCVG